MALMLMKNSIYDTGKPTLTRRETEVLSQVALGKSSKAIADLLFVSTRTVEYHLSRIYEKLGASNRVQAILAAGNLELIPDIPAQRNSHRMRDERKFELISVAPISIR